MSVPSLISPDITPTHTPTKPRLAIMASGNGSNFEAIATAIHNQQLNAQIALLIYNNPAAGVVQRADRLAIPHQLINHRDYPSRETLDQAIVAALKAHQIDWVIMAGWMRIVTPILTEAYRDRLLNIHPSLLPSFRGHRAIEQALQAGVKITGCTVHQVVPEVDAGTIIMQAAVPIFASDTLETVTERIHQQEHIIYPRAIALALQQTHHLSR
ncbi:MAG: phosphoribosylglycinamide formyltransferase [Alkalinema sp. RU_4_3]|nr:phosphoribosylglycinamide formyltransferase [Alkalinema sp. RU_4_3]